MSEVDQTAGAPPEQTSRFDEVSTEGIFSGGPLAVLARLGSLRVFIVLAIIWIIFQTQNDNFLSSFNLTNLVLQIAGVGMISIGVTLILLLGEIDLSVGAVSGLAAAVMAVLNVKHGWSPYTAIAAALAVGLAIGVLNGFFVTQFGIPSFVLRLATVAIGTIAAILILTSDRGVPLAGLILIGFCAMFVFITERTVWGRHVFAVGGNDEAARRAGIRVRRVRMTVFALASMFSAAGGILLAARLQAVNQSSGGSDLLLLAIAGPVIAGTSLFGGRGSIWGALLGALVIGSISNGMDLLGLKSEDKFLITGGVLLIAVVIDALIRNERAKAGARR
jgi:D-xylose transport system permease protein